MAGNHLPSPSSHGLSATQAGFPVGGGAAEPSAPPDPAWRRRPGIFPCGATSLVEYVDGWSCTSTKRLGVGALLVPTLLPPAVALICGWDVGRGHPAFRQCCLESAAAAVGDPAGVAAAANALNLRVIWA